MAGLPAQTIARAKTVLAKLEQYELAVFSEVKQKSDGLETAVGHASQSRMASQFSLFAITNENVIDELRSLIISEMSEKEAKEILEELQKRII